MRQAGVGRGSSGKPTRDAEVANDDHAGLQRSNATLGTSRGVASRPKKTQSETEFRKEIESTRRRCEHNTDVWKFKQQKSGETKRGGGGAHPQQPDGGSQMKLLVVRRQDERPQR